jgi:P-type Ca2+ transporter type 2C
MVQGLTTSTATQRLKNYGYNELPSARPKNIWRIAAEVVKEPMFLLLLSCSTLYTILGDYKEGVILVAAIFVIIGITFYQYRKTERALDALKKLSSPRALVIRDGVEVRIAGRELVPGDVIILHEGDRIAADAMLIDSSNLTVDESLLTGESIAVTKTVDDGKSVVFSGTLVVQGTGMAEVTATGIHSQFGKIGVSLKNIESDETRLQKEMKILIKRLLVGGVFLSVAVVVGYYYSRGNFIQALLSGLAASMAILPEEFPVVLTIFLALGAWRLSRKNVLTRSPSAIETLGSATVLCTDKTGTITQNKMEVAILYDGNQIVSREGFERSDNSFSQLLRVGFRASQRNSIDPMEQAIQKSHEETSIRFNDLKVVREYPLSKQLLAMTRVLQNTDDQSTSVSAKGAPETIFDLCHLDEAEKNKHLKAVHEMADQGYRVIAVAEAQHESHLPEVQTGFDFSFLGLIGLEDPIRPEVPNAIAQCNDAGIRVIMITGDFPTTAKSIAKQIGLATDGEVITGHELNAMSDEELRGKIRNTTIFARIVPEQKLRIVKALKANGDVVAMTGDGVNDAPALKAANIGVAMGRKGTDVAREASSLVLLDDNFASIVSAIHSGRRIYDNLQKAMSYIMAIHIPIIGLALLPAFVPSLPILLLPLHIIFMELIIDPVCTIAFESEQDEKGIMKRKPRNPNESFFGMKRIVLSLFSGTLLLAMVLGVYFLSIHEGHTEGEVRAIAFSSLIIGNIFLILTDLSKTRSFVSVFAEKNWAAISILGIAFTLLMVTLYVPSLQAIFSFQFPGFYHFVPSAIGAASVLFVLESIKRIRAKLKSRELTNR